MRHPRPIRTLACAAAAAAAVTSLAACSGSSAATASAHGSAAPVHAAADAIDRAVQKTGGYSSAAVKGTIVVSNADQTVTMNGRYGWKPLAMDVSVGMPGMQSQLGVSSFRELLSGSVAYLNAGDKLAAQTGGKHWLKMDLHSLGSAGQGMAQMLDEAGSRDPGTQLRLLLSAPDVAQVGTDTMHGVTATHYHGTVTMSELAKLEGGATAKLYEQAKQQGVTSEIADLWVGANQLPVRVEVEAETSQGLATSTFDYSDFSTSPLTVTVPPAADSADLGALIGGAGGGTGGSA